LNLHEFGEPVSPALKLVRLHTQGQLKDFLLTSGLVAASGWLGWGEKMYKMGQLG